MAEKNKVPGMSKEAAIKPARKIQKIDSFPIVGIGASAGGLEAIEGYRAKQNSR